ncbi:TPR repeat-containing protein DDB_G0287407-like [Mercenaria mercenaria]|uniref:TPR repeat-containing protein DDB_G0287407-like n=1 Tax=Mercenaria mercenaria TaxID=6596 RepID=UPI00234E89F2|nr:TPR repeat-containing protein DDB_G0287407-like [Mercenaria mercenaria]XP_045167547.2 TPR repeat-containing protein DDB_G0287407-like [Mercenaria mercenaria]XP_045167552.2 TPR repeat-containing protein DDB_G0287407-like [Mercenaria mercenaria]XP_045167558.2 TPR repeat-containing protein DDB_G0287407-like [Mercenaria mercenaria]XP_045167564.2 TPR repeat-containing protein DDB_G0287407-like [Mercenaria mercenaria]
MPKLRNPRVVKIFFSSPFGGMEEEREELTRRYFPSIHHLCNSYGLQFAAVDMRWGITSESSDNAQVISICLREIDRSDMFIGFFGQRYGWHGADDTGLQKNFDNALTLYPWLEQFRDKSVTELEFLHGFLNEPGHLPAAIFFRDNHYDDMIREEGAQKGDKKQVFKYSAESELSTKLMDDLKQRVWQHREESLGVHMDYKTPTEAAKIMYDTIMSYLKDSLLADLDTEKRTAREELLGQHDAFLSSRCNIFVHGEIYMQQLNKQLLSEQGQNVLVIGKAGSGKSALLCNWISALQQDNNNYTIVYHFIGFADGSADVNSMLSRLTEEFEYILSKMMDGSTHTRDDPESIPGSDVDNDAEKTRQLVQRLLSVLDKLISLGKTPILVLDGLDKIIKTSNIKKVLFWLPTHFPASARVVLSTLESDIQNIDELRNRNYLMVHIDPLPNEFKHDMCVKILKETGKELSPPQLERIVAADMTKNPLFLKITLSELVAFGYFRLLDKKIDSLITSESIEALFQQVLTRLEEDYNVADYQDNLVEQVMSSIQLSSQGLSETEIMDIFSIPDHVWSPLYFAIEKLVISQSGRIQFGYKELGEAVCMKYLKNQDNKKSYMRKLVEYFTADLKKLDQSNCVHGQHLTVCRPAYELPHLLLQLGDMEQFKECLSNFFVFSHLASNIPYQLVQLWRHTDLLGEDIADRLLASFDKRISEIYLLLESCGILQNSTSPGVRLVQFLLTVAEVLSIAGHTEAKKKVFQRAISIVEDGLQGGRVVNPEEWKETLYKMKYKLACIYCESYHTAELGIQLHKDLVKHHESLLEENGRTPKLLTELGHAFHGIGVGYYNLGQYNEVEKYTKKSIVYHEESGNASLDDIGASWAALAMCLIKENEYEKSLEYIEKAIEAFKTHFFGEYPTVIGEMLTNKAICLRHLGRLEEAESVYQSSLELKIKAVGREHVTVAMTYSNLCALEGIRGNYDASAEHAKQALKIYEAVGETWDNPKYIGALENRLCALVSANNFEEADKDFMTILNWRLKDGSIDHCLGSVYQDMGRYYLRAGMYEKAYQVFHALIGSKFRQDGDCVTYLLLDIACGNLPPKFRDQLTEEYTLTYGVELAPGNVSLLKQLVIYHLIPSNNTEEISRIISKHHDTINPTGVEVYLHTCDWCVNSEGQINEECQQAILTEGLLKYPDNLDLHMNLAKSYCRIGQQGLALPHALKVAEQQLENPKLLLFTAHTAALAGQCDVCTKWCSHLLEHFTDEDITTPVHNILKKNEEIREYLKQNVDQSAD